MKLSDDDKEHFEPVYLATSTLVASTLLVTAASVTLTCLVLRSFVPATLVSAAEVLAVLSAFLAGNAYRLGDMRTRAGFRAKVNGQQRRQVLAEMVPLRVVEFRFRIARLGFIVSFLMVVLSFLTVEFDRSSLSPLAGVAVLGIGASAIAFMCGMWSRPID